MNPQEIEWKTSKGLISYPEAVAAMESRVEAVIAEEEGELAWLLEHEPLYTAGTSAKTEDLLDVGRFPVYESKRGGQYTYHGPGQRVAYLVMNLKVRQAMDLRNYVFNLEQWVINTLAEFGIQGERREGRVGIWVVTGENREDKIAAIGVRIRKWVTSHGIAINVNPDLSHFTGIVPCGLSQYGVTSLHRLGVKASMEEVDKVLEEQFRKLFN